MRRRSGAASRPCGRTSFGRRTLLRTADKSSHTLHAEHLVTQEHALPDLERALAAHRDAHAVAAAEVVDDEGAVHFAKICVAPAHRLVVREGPVARVAPDRDRAPLRQILTVATAAVGPELREAR